MRTDVWNKASVLQNAAREILKLHTGNTSKIRDKRGYSSIHDWELHIGVMELHIMNRPPPPPPLKRKKMSWKVYTLKIPGILFNQTCF